MSGPLHLWAVGIDTVERIASAPPDLAQHLYRVTAHHFPVRTGEPGHGLSDKFGPLVRRPRGAPVVELTGPTLPDAEAMLAGRFVSPDRLEPAWRLFQTWLDNLSVARMSHPATAAQIETADFDLSRAGVPSNLDLHHFWQRSFQMPLGRVPGLAIGWLRGDLVVEVAAAWRAHVDDVEGSVDLVRAVLDFLERWPEFRATALAQGQAAPDLVTSWRS
jgi:hypothetical protein